METIEGSNVVREMGDLREKALENYTIPRAIDDALWMRGIPEAVLSTDRARQVIETLLAALEASPCYLKAQKLGLRTFTLLPYDMAGHAALGRWIKKAREHGCREEKLADAQAILNEWSARPDLKWPD